MNKAEMLKRAKELACTSVEDLRSMLDFEESVSVLECALTMVQAQSSGKTAAKMIERKIKRLKKETVA